MLLNRMSAMVALAVLALFAPVAGVNAAGPCDKVCLEAIGDQYRAAYVAHDPSKAPFAKNVRFVENNVEMLNFPEATWDTVTKEVGPALTLSDPTQSAVGIFTTIMQNDTPGFLAIRLKVRNRQIIEIEHIISTKRNLSAPPTPIGDVETFKPDADLYEPVPPAERASRADLVRLANGYFSTLEQNTGVLHTVFAEDAVRHENGKAFDQIAASFRLGRYQFNERLRDRDFFLVDEVRGIAMARAYIDHKGALDEYTLTDGTKTRSSFREPHTWSMFEAFKIKDGKITNVIATFISAPYYIWSPFSKRPK